MEAIDLVNHFGQVIAPGSTVIALVKSAGYTSVHHGLYLGMDKKQACVELEGRQVVWDDDNPDYRKRKHHIETFKYVSKLKLNKVYPTTAVS